MKKTIETKTAKDMKTAISLVEEFFAPRVITFEFDTENYGESLKNGETYRHFNGTNEKGADGYAMIEIFKGGECKNFRVINGELKVIRVFNFYRDTVIDIVIENFVYEINEKKFQVNVRYEVSENGIIAGGMNGTTTATAQEAAQWIINFAEENSNYTITEFSIRDCETYKKYRSEDADIQALNSKSEATTEETTKAATDNNVETAIDKLVITTKERPDGTPTAYYVNGVKTRKHRIEFYYANNPAYDGLIEIDHYVARYYLPEIYNNKSRVIFKNWGGTGKTIVTKAAAEELGLRIGRKVAINPTLYLVEENTEEIIEVDPAEYAITLEAMEIATNAEINAATNEAKRKQISFLKSDIHYREGALKDLEENHLAKYPNDESLKELRAEWLNELSDLKAQLANLENGEDKAVAEAKEAVKERDTEFEKVMTEIRFFAHCMDVKSLKKQIADAENEINSLVRMINRAGKTYGTPAYNPDNNEEFINNLGADLADKLNKLANLKAALAKMAPYEIGESDADNSVEIYNVGRAGVLNRSHKKTNKMITGFLDANIEYEKEARRKTG